MDINTGFDELLYLVVSWAKVEGVFEAEKLNKFHVALLLVQYGVGYLVPSITEFMVTVKDVDKEVPRTKYSLQRRGEFLLSFFVSFIFFSQTFKCRSS